MKPVIYLVEDDPAFRSVMEIILRNDYDVASFEKPEDALRSMADEVPDAIVSDTVMPRMNGPGFCNFVKSHHPNVGIVGMSSDESKERLWEGVADRFVYKFHYANIPKVVEQVLELYREIASRQ